MSMVTLSILRYRGVRNCWFGFRNMGIIPGQLHHIPGLAFAKMLGSGGGNGFSIWPDFSTYGLLAVWENEHAARTFLEKHDIAQHLTRRAHQHLTLFMRAAQVHGNWAGQNPFPVTTEYQPDQLVAVLTRATIRTRHLWRFWRFVPRVSASMSQHREGLLFSKGVGELPLIQQATVSIWRDSHAMRAYAYQSKHHQQVIRKTRELDWYAEELFARFHPYDAHGQLDDLDLSRYFSRDASAKKAPL